MKKIETYAQLREEKILTRLRIKELEEQIRDDFAEIKNDLKPLNLAGTAIRNMMTSEKHGVIGETIDFTVNTLVKKVLFRKTNFVTRTLISFVAKNYANNLLAKNSENILEKIQSLFGKLRGNHRDKEKDEEENFDKSTANVDFS